MADGETHRDPYSVPDRKQRRLLERGNDFRQRREAALLDGRLRPSLDLLEAATSAQMKYGEGETEMGRAPEESRPG
jgi:hypothetical protein